MGVEVALGIHHVAAVAFQSGFLVVRREPEVRLDVIDAEADELLAIRINEPPDAVNLLDVDEAGLGGMGLGQGRDDAEEESDEYRTGEVTLHGAGMNAATNGMSDFSCRCWRR